MDNSYFLYNKENAPIDIDRFHICTWEFSDSTALIEFGFEIEPESIQQADIIHLALFIPWLNEKCSLQDLYPRLADSSNSRFIFNDSIYQTTYLDGGTNKFGVIHTFKLRERLCVLPAALNTNYSTNEIEVQVSLNRYRAYNNPIGEGAPKIYIRFLLKVEALFISNRKRGINKSTILYDIKLNERRNIPEEFLDIIDGRIFCNIKTCFCLNIIPNDYDIVFFDNSALQNVRNLEYESFRKYLGDDLLKNDELIVIFYKKSNGKPFSFFSIYSKERIGTGQFALAILINIVCGMLLFIPSYRRTFTPVLSIGQVWNNLPNEILVGFGIVFIMLCYFLWPGIVWIYTSIKFRLISKSKK